MLGLPSDSVKSAPISATGPEPWNERDRLLREFSQGESEFLSIETAERFQAARLLMQHHEFSPARKLLRAVLSEAPFSGAAIRAMAECAWALGQEDERLSLLRSLVRMDDHPQNLMLYANALYDGGRDQEALKLYLTALHSLESNSPLLFDIFKNIGNIYVRCHDFESAEDNYNRAYTLNSDSAPLLVNFGTLEIQKQNWSGAVTRFREAVELDPRSDRAWVGLAIAHRQFGDLDLSWANLARALDLNPENTTALQLALSWVVKDERWTTVCEWLERYLERRSDDPAMSLALAQLWFLAGRWQAARWEAVRALSLDPHLDGATELLSLIDREQLKESHGRDEGGASASA